MIMKVIKKSQIGIYILSIILVFVGYLNYKTQDNIENYLPTTSMINSIKQGEQNECGEKNSEGEISSLEENDECDTFNEAIANEKVADIGDAQLVSSNEVYTKKDDYFSVSKLERNTMYSQRLETYENILNSTNSLDAQRQTATEEIEKINKEKNSIMICENLLKTKGFENSVIFINGDSISIIIESENLSNEEIAQIQNIISRELNAAIENIHISVK